MALTCALPATADDTAPGAAQGTPVQGVPMVTRKAIPLVTQTKAPGANHQAPADNWSRPIDSSAAESTRPGATHKPSDGLRSRRGD